MKKSAMIRRLALSAEGVITIAQIARSVAGSRNYVRTTLADMAERGELVRLDARTFTKP